MTKNRNIDVILEGIINSFFELHHLNFINLVKQFQLVYVETKVLWK